VGKKLKIFQVIENPIQDSNKEANMKCPQCGYQRTATDDPSIPDYECPACGVNYVRYNLKLNNLLPTRRSPRKTPEAIHNSSQNNTKQLLGIIGSIILFVGVFTPIISIPVVGNMNYFQNGKGDGTIVLILAVISFVLVLTKNYKRLWFTGLGSLGVTLFTFINFQSKMSQMKSQMESQLEGNPFRSFADVAIQSTQLQWGWALLIIGAGLVIASAALKE
jgi:predicted RNA-binding Zn-ribbon protein involved in translation (DUF1610 family)